MKWVTPPLLALAALAGAVTAARADDAAHPPAAAPAHGVENSVVKVFSTIRSPDVFKPWTKEPPREVRGSGVVIEGRRILTNAHVVLYATQVQVEGEQAGDRISATVESIAPGIDLAVLKLDDETFFDSHFPLPRANILPSIKDAVLTYGFPTGGDSLSITKGIVSRIEFVPYNFPVLGLRIQIDAAINPGNSGGPAVVGDKLIGLAFSHLREAENIGYIIPCEEIDLFLQGVAGGRRYSKPTMFDEMQSLQNPALRSLLKLDPGVKGIVVNRPDRDDPGYPLREWDVITRIGNTRVDDEGMVRIGDDLRVRFAYLIQREARNRMVPLTIVREGKTRQIQLPMSADHPMLLPALQGAYPDYFIFGPLVFSTGTADFINSLNSASKGTLINAFSAVGNPMVTRRGAQPAFAGERLVVISSPFFPHALAKGYGSPMGRVVATVNGVAVKNLRHLVEILRDATEKDIVIKFQGRGTETLVFPRRETIAATDDILADNGVRSQASPELLAVWNARPAK